MADAERSDETNPPPPQGSNDRASSYPHRAVLLLASLGLVLSLVLEYVHARTYLLPTAESFCTVGEALDCTLVAASRYSVFLNVPWAIWGALGYATILAAALRRSPWLLPLSALAALASLVLLGISVLEIGTLCSLCEGVHLTSWVLFALVFKHRSALSGSILDTSGAANIFALPAGSAVALMLFMPTYWGSYSYKSAPPFSTGVTEEGDPWIGAQNPSFTFHEFVDYRCPHCKVTSTRTMRRLARNSDWRMVRHQQPRMECPAGRDPACIAARLAYCAGKQDRFWRADRWLFVVPDPRKEIDIEAMISDLALDGRALKACFSSEEAFGHADAAYQLAKKKKITEVPGYMVDDKALKLHEFEEYVKSTGK